MLERYFIHIWWNRCNSLLIKPTFSTGCVKTCCVAKLYCYTSLISSILWTWLQWLCVRLWVPKCGWTTLGIEIKRFMCTHRWGIVLLMQVIIHIPALHQWQRLKLNCNLPSYNKCINYNVHIHKSNCHSKCVCVCDTEGACMWLSKGLMWRTDAGWVSDCGGMLGETAGGKESWVQIQWNRCLQALSSRNEN